jgi:hypothetical protein
MIRRNMIPDRCGEYDNKFLVCNTGVSPFMYATFCGSIVAMTDMRVMFSLPLLVCAMRKKGLGDDEKDDKVAEFIKSARDNCGAWCS